MVRVCKLWFWIEPQKDTQWHKHRSLQSTVLPLGHPALTLALLPLHYLLSLSSILFPSLQNHKHYVVPAVHESLSLMLHLGLHYLQFILHTSLAHKRRVHYVLWIPLWKWRTQTAAGPWAENDLTHSISLASIMTVCQHSEAASSKSDAKDFDVPSDDCIDAW